MSSAVFAQSLEISKNPDFSTADKAFTFNETLYARVTAPQIDFNNLDKNEYSLKSNNFSDEERGALVNNRNSTYTIALALSLLNRAEHNWEFRVEIADKQQNEFKTTVNLTILDNPPPVIVELEDEIEELTANSLKISGTTVLADTSTRVTEFGQALNFSDLQLLWKVHVRAEQRADLLWALTIAVLERASTDMVTARGRMANLYDSVMIVNNINFRVVSKTLLQDKNGAAIPLADFRVGMLVEVRGTASPAGKIAADLGKIEDENFAGKEIEFTGIVNDNFARPPLPDSLRLNGDLFEVDAQTELRGFNDEPILPAELRAGEILQLKALTRLNRLPLALRLKRRLDFHGDVQVKGRIERLQDPALIVGGIEFFRSATTIILDDENLFIPFTALRSGLHVEVVANRGADNRLTVLLIKIEDEDNDEIELTGLIKALTDTSVTVSGFVFRVNSATVVLDQNRLPMLFSNLRPNLLVEIRGDRRFDGSLLAAEIHLEDLLRQNEIELRGEIAAITGNAIRVTDLNFFADGATAIFDLQGAPASVAQLAAGMIVEIRARSAGSVWQASRIKIENSLEAQVTLIGAIDSLAADALRLGRRWILLTGQTVLRGLNDEAINFAGLNVSDVVEVLAQPLPDSSLIALRVKRENRSVRDIEVQGPLVLHGPTSVSASSIFFLVDAATIIVDAENRPLAFADLRNGQIAMVTGSRQITGVILANRIQLQNYRVLSGVIDALASNTISVAQISHAVSAKTFFADEQNLPIFPSELSPQQQVRVLANAKNGGWEILHLQVVYRNTASTAVDEPFDDWLPKRFVLYQNFPNPFSDGAPSRRAAGASAFTIIRFALPQPQEFSLTIYNRLGQKIHTLAAGHLPAGIHERAWDGCDANGTRVASGIYFYRLQAGEHIEQRRMAIVR
jgi:hypothetical protein